ncbi:MAG: HIT family protein [Bacilli bacterium]|jgi:histidine triad (HIT) family protein|nr:HIT family protein [Bacilli bacterium]
MENCIFCKIVNGEIPSYKVYEDNDFLAFLDISQVTKGHTLVIPKKHYQDIHEIDVETMSNLYKVVHQLANDITSKTKAKGVNILNNNGLVAGQTVFHFHVHIIPRYDDNDKIDIKFNENGSVNIDEVYKLLTNDK